MSKASSPSVGHWSAKEEPLGKYTPFGYRQVHLGDILGSHYRVIRKLGWGVYSTVWLVQHQRDKNFAALKLLTAAATNSQSPKLHELEYLQHMRDRSPTHPGYKHVVHLLDHVYQEGESDKHSCLVSELLCEDLHSFGRCKYGRLPKALLKRVTRQVVLGLDYLHSECNIIHTDIKPSNIMLVPPEGFLIPENINAAFETHVENDKNGRQVTRARSKPLDFPLPKGDMRSFEIWRDIEVRLGDVGVACWGDKVEEHFTDLIQSSALRAPEVCIGSGWGKPADIWSLGCTVFELALGKSLLPADCRPESVPYLHGITFGQYPIEMIKQGKYSDVFFKPDGSFNIDLPGQQPLEYWLHGQGGPTPGSILFLDFLKRMLTIDPTARATCQELLAHEWLNSEI